MSKNLNVTQDGEGFEVERYAPSRVPKTVFKSDVLWRDEPLLSISQGPIPPHTGVGEEGCLETIIQYTKTFQPRTRRARLTLIDESLQHWASPIPSTLQKKSFTPQELTAGPWYLKLLESQLLFFHWSFQNLLSEWLASGYGAHSPWNLFCPVNYCT